MDGFTNLFYETFAITTEFVKDCERKSITTMVFDFENALQAIADIAVCTDIKRVQLVNNNTGEVYFEFIDGIDPFVSRNLNESYGDWVDTFHEKLDRIRYGLVLG